MMANELIDSGSAPGSNAGAAAASPDAVDPGDLKAVLAAVLGAEPTPEQLTAMQGDQALMALVKQYAEIQRTTAAIEEAKQFAAQPKPDPYIGGVLGGIGRRDNPDYARWQQDQARYKPILDKYFQLGSPSLGELQAYKSLQSQVTSLQSRLVNQIAKVQTKTDAPDKPPNVVNVPTGKPGETQPSVWETGPDGKPHLVPATGPDGKPVPPSQGSVPQTPAPRVDEGTQSWELKELNGVWYQVPIRARKDGSWEPDTSRTPVPASGFPAEPGKVEVYDGIPYTRVPDGKGGSKLEPVAGYVKPPMFRTDAQGRGYTSTDNGVTWKPASGLPGTPQTMTSNGTVYPLDENGLPIVDRGVRLPPGEQTQTVDGYLVRADPATGEVRRVDLYTPEQRARLNQTQDVTLQTAQQNLQNAQRLQDPVAEYQRQVQTTQQQATSYRDDLNQQVLEGRLSVEDASKRFDDWWGTNVEAKLSPFRTMAEASYRKEQNEYQRAQAAEQARVDAINRQREQVGYQAGETARNQLNALAPQARSPEFLDQLAQNVSRIGQPLPGGVTQHSGGMAFSPESLSLANVRRAMPNLTEVGQNAAARALAQISPAAAQQVGLPPPPVPSLPDVQGFMNTAPFRIPNPALPVPGQEALDLGNPANAGRLGLPVQPGFAGTRMQGGQVLPPWQIPAA